MKPVLTLTILFFAFVSSWLPAAAQEHVDVPLPPYDPPPAASHHSESHLDQSPGVSQETHAKPKVSARPHAKPKASRGKGKIQCEQRQQPRHKKQSKSHHHSSEPIPTSAPQLFPLALATLINDCAARLGPTKGELRSGNSFSCLGHAPLGKVAMETAAAKKSCDKTQPGKMPARIEGTSSLPARRPGRSK